MFRELEEETGLLPEHVKILGRTRDWLRYEVPDHFIKREIRGHYRGQKQIWFLLRMVGRDCDVNLRASTHPEFDAWRWHDYWVPLDTVIEFKRGVYQMALQELSRFLHRQDSQKKPYHQRRRHQDSKPESVAQKEIKQEHHQEQLITPIITSASIEISTQVEISVTTDSSDMSTKPSAGLGGNKSS